LLFSLKNWAGKCKTQKTLFNNINFKLSHFRILKYENLSNKNLFLREIKTPVFARRDQ